MLMLKGGPAKALYLREMQAAKFALAGLIEHRKKANCPQRQKIDVPRVIPELIDAREVESA